MIKVTIETDTIEEFDSLIDGYSTSRESTINESKRYMLEQAFEELKKDGNK